MSETKEISVYPLSDYREELLKLCPEALEFADLQEYFDYAFKGDDAYYDEWGYTPVPWEKEYWELVFNREDA
ncbi:hypothetical protein [uncultured Mobiluncus sp.]|uniref:hypothetical protein n=1 Tax=uncultured Mobiluncus sp. TaxID=293425 RepID=UPI00261A02D4|nr:hypothetical protein [uncultured Mobiluncus sp.]